MSRTRRYTLPIEMEEGQHRVDDSGPMTDPTARNRRTSVINTHGPLRATGLILLFVLPLGIVAGLVGARSQGVLDLDENERDRLETDRAREEFDEWITTARLPGAVFDAPHVEVDSLERLADISIDTNNRVIEDPKRDGYFVLHEEIVYVHSAT